MQAGIDNQVNRKKADRKRNLIPLIQNHGLADRFPPGMLMLSPSDKEALLIRWEVATILFNQEKSEVFANIGTESGAFLIFAQKPDIFDILIGLLQHKADYDASVISLAAGDRGGRFTNKIVGRNQYEYFEYLDILRNQLEEFFLSVRHDKFGPERNNVTEAVEAKLEPFKQRFEAHLKTISATAKNVAILEKVARFIREYPSIEPAKEETHVRHIYTGGGDYIEKPSQYTKSGNIYNLTTPAANLLKSTDLGQLALQLQTVLKAAKSRANTSAEYTALAEIADAMDAAAKGDRGTTGQKIATFGKEAGKWVWEIAKDLSATTLAKLIEPQYLGG